MIILLSWNNNVVTKELFYNINNINEKFNAMKFNE